MQRPTILEALKFWIKLGFISFGGPVGQVAIMHEFLVEKKKWISNSKFLHALNYCMLLPGPEAQQLATYMGWLLHGRLGGLLAGILFILPSMFILLFLSIVYVLFGKVSWVTAFFDGLKPAVIAIVILALFKIGKKSLLSKIHYLIAIIAFVCIFFFKIQFPIIIFGVIIFALTLRYFFPNLFRAKITSQRTNNDEEETYLINRFSQIPNAGFNPLKIFKQVAIALVLWSIPMLTFYFFLSDFQFWRNLSFFFTKAAFVTFGGAYAVLPYVAQVSVEKFNWLSNLEMIDGLALGETTPGPLIMILVYVGFMAGYNHFEGSILMGSAGLLMTSFYTFLPSFFFILIGAPIVERTQENERIKEILSLITAAVFGVILNLILFFSKAVFCEQKQFSINSVDYVSLIWTIVSVFALTRLKINMILWIAASGVFGIINYLIFNG